MTLDFNQNFWKANPSVEALEFFYKLKNEDKSKSQEESSKLMWACALCLHPKSLIFAVPSKWEDVKKTILKDPKFNWESKKNKDIVSAFTDVCLSIPEKSYFYWCDYMKKREEYCNSIDFKTADIKQIEMVEKIRSTTVKAYQELEIIKTSLRDEESIKNKKTNTSFTDEGRL
jgi:uncharacterized protein involved in tolerance to divalent cations